MSVQAAIKGDKLTIPDPLEAQCEWCDKRADDSLPLMCRVKGKRGARTPSGMRTYFCKRHREQAKNLTKDPIR